MKILIMYDAVPEGAPKDVQDTLVSVESVGKALADLGHTVFNQPVTINYQETVTVLDRIRPDLVFNLVESVLGNGRLSTIGPLLLDHLGIPYTGCRADSIFITTDKILTKRILKMNHLPTPDWYTLRELKTPDRFDSGDYIIKSRWEDASIGLDEDSVVRTRDRDELVFEMNQRGYGVNGTGFAEKYIDHREFNVSLLAREGTPDVLPPSEMIFYGYDETRRKVVGYRAKWDEESFEHTHTRGRFEFPPEDDELLDSLKSLALRCWSLFALQGYARVDFRVDEKGHPTVLEINANPCLSPGAGFMSAAAKARVGYIKVIDRIVTAALPVQH